MNDRALCSLKIFTLSLLRDYFLMMTEQKKILATYSLIPFFKGYCAKICALWDEHWLINRGVFTAVMSSCILCHADDVIAEREAADYTCNVVVGCAK